MKKYNLIDILSNIIEEFKGNNSFKLNGVIIPIIQRDYAHGREDAESTRKRFLKSIFNALEKNQNLELDFIYGSIENIDGNNNFIPLDGQQRLTTLFLLYWYIANHELQDEELVKQYDILVKFTYATRITARNFCEKIMKVKLDKNELPSISIKNKMWFHNVYNNDPTVKAMLKMLDEIHIMYNKRTKPYWNNLANLNFYVLILNGFKLTDELYIKMNARGKQLTNYENFKADFIKWMKSDTNPFVNKFQNKAKDNEIQYFLNYESKFDNKWTNFLWKYAITPTDDKGARKQEDKIVDPLFMRIFNRYFLNEYILRKLKNIDSVDSDKSFDKLYGKKGDDTDLIYDSFDIYEDILKSDNTTENIEKVLDSLTEHYDEMKEIIKPSWSNKDIWNIFNELINQRQRILFLAITLYLINNEYNSVSFKRWIRVVWNIIIDPDIRSIKTMITAIKLIEILSEGSGDIYKYLASDDFGEKVNTLSSKYQLEEERLKAILIQKDPKWETEIIKAESHPYFKGKIRFLFEKKQNTTINEFIEFRKAAFEIFKDEDGNPGKPNNYLWLRATLAKSANIKPEITLADGDWDNWRELINKDLMNGFIGVIKEYILSNSTVNSVFINIIKNYKPNKNEKWVNHLILWENNEGKCLLDYSKTGKIEKCNYNNEEIKQVYLFNKTYWLESNILLSNNRNEIVSLLIMSSKGITLCDEANIKNRNIDNTFFGGANVELKRDIDGIKWTYNFDREFVKVGIMIADLDNPNEYNQFLNEDIEEGWLCRKKYNYNDIKSETEISKLIENIENAVFNKDNSDSLISRLV